MDDFHMNLKLNNDDIDPRKGEEMINIITNAELEQVFAKRECIGQNPKVNNHLTPINYDALSMANFQQSSMIYVWWKRDKENFQKPLRNIESLKQNLSALVIMQHVALFGLLVWCDKSIKWQLEMA